MSSEALRDWRAEDQAGAHALALAKHAIDLPQSPAAYDGLGA